MNIALNSFAFSSPSSVETSLLSSKSDLLPTNTKITFSPLSALTSSYQ